MTRLSVCLGIVVSLDVGICVLSCSAMSAYLNFSILTYFREANLLNNERYSNTNTSSAITIATIFNNVILFTVRHNPPSPSRFLSALLNPLLPPALPSLPSRTLSSPRAMQRTLGQIPFRQKTFSPQPSLLPLMSLLCLAVQ